MLQSSQYRRVKERYIWEVIQKVQDWRSLFQNGLIDESGNLKKLSLHEAAEYVGIPKKTLEDYQQLLKKASSKVSLSDIQNQKMGYLRKLIREGKVKNIRGTPGRKPTNSVNLEQDSTTHEQIQTQQSQYQGPTMEEQGYDESQEEYDMGEENVDYFTDLDLLLSPYQQDQNNQAAACPEEMIIDGDYQPDLFDWEEDQIQKYPDEYSQIQKLPDENVHHIPMQFTYHNIVILVKDSSLLNPSPSDESRSPLFDEDIDLFKNKETIQIRDKADDDTDCEE